jgi:hypothetical protein
MKERELIMGKYRPKKRGVSLLRETVGERVF